MKSHDSRLANLEIRRGSGKVAYVFVNQGETEAEATARTYPKGAPKNVTFVRWKAGE